MQPGDMMIFELRDIRRIRKQNMLTQKALAQHAQLSQSLIAKIESGRTEASYSNAKKIFQALSEMTSKEKHAGKIMNKDTVSAEPDESLHNVIKKMHRLGISQMPVLKGTGIIGMVSESTILEAMAEKKQVTHVRDVMQDAPPIIAEQASLDTVRLLLREYPIVLVCKNGTLLGHITKSEVIRAAFAPSRTEKPV